MTRYWPHQLMSYTGIYRFWAIKAIVILDASLAL